MFDHDKPAWKRDQEYWETGDLSVFKDREETSTTAWQRDHDYFGKPADDSFVGVDYGGQMFAFVNDGLNSSGRKYSTVGTSTDVMSGTTGVTLRLSSGGPVGLDYNLKTKKFGVGYRYY